MGSNGSFAGGTTASEEGRRWKTVLVLSKGIKVIELKNPQDNHKAPEESHSPNSIYVMINKNGDGIKSISKYGSDGKKIFEIHTIDHKGLGVHYHEWSNGRPLSPHSITHEMGKILDEIKKLL